MRRGLNVPGPDPTLHHTPEYKQLLAKAAERLHGLRTTDVAEE